MHPLPSPDSHHLLAAQGWVELGNMLEADAELECIRPKFRVHPDVLEIRWTIYSSARKWKPCMDIASTLVLLAPERSTGWIHRSFALHELGQTQEAYDQLLPAADRFKDHWQIPYNLACYCSRLDRMEEAQTWLKKALLLEEKTVQNAAIDDPDLKPLWDSLSTSMWEQSDQ